MSNLAILFPGQGSQFNDMGQDFMSRPEYAQVQDLLFSKYPECKSALVGDLDINDTRYAQLLLFANQIGIIEVIKSEFEMTDAAYGGFSLGEYSAYYQAGIYSLEQGLDIISKRSTLMADVTSTYATKVILGLTKDQLTAAVKQLNQIVANPVIISNYNLEKQLLLNFDASDLEVVTEKLKDAGAKRIVDLAVSGPFHTKIYQEAANQYIQFLETLSLPKPSGDLYLNLTGKKYSGEDIKQTMGEHIVCGVQWKTEIESMIDDGIDTFIEIGSKSVVSAMVKKINRKVNVITIEKLDDLIKLEEVWNKK